MPMPLLGSIQLQGFLSFGPTSEAIPLTGLNILIGPNGSGKSNLVEALSVLRAVPKDLPLPIRAGGGVKDWLWQGATPAQVVAARKPTINFVPPASTVDIESIAKDKLYQMLKEATRDTKTKGAYGKGNHSFNLLETLDPAAIQQASPWAKRFFTTLDKQLR
jgi:predicted ATPase